MPPPSVRSLFLALAALVMFTACSSPEGAGTAPVATGPTASSVVETIAPVPSTAAPAPGAASVAPAEWTPCGSLQCATVTVPLDHGQPDGPSIEIALNRRPATGRRQGTIFVNPGGPGGSGIGFVRQGFSLDSATMATYDLVGFDPRGVGASTPVTCELDRSNGPQPDYSPDTPAETAALENEAEQFARACATTDADLLAHLRTEDVADDLDLLRQAVGDDQLHYIGFSFGTLIGLVYAERFPDRVGHLVLDGVVDPEQDLPELLTEQSLAFERAFAILDTACGTTLQCPAGGAAQAHDEIMSRLERDGPVGQVGPAELDGAALITLYDQAYWPLYTGALSDALDGNYAGIEQLSDAFTGIVPFGTYAGVECTDGPRPADVVAWRSFAAEVEAQAPRFGAAVANELLTCAWWPVPSGPARGPLTAPGAAPILVIGNTNDPATPLANAEAVASHLAGAALVVADLDGHTAYSSSPCVQDLVASYFLDSTLPDPGTRC